jgi:N-acetylglutamate synthase-like GNAT family acetyltransferase
MVTRRAHRDEIQRIVAFYRSFDYTPSIGPEDVLVIAELDDSLCGVVRLCQEQGVLVLRGMRVRQDVRRQGIGTRLLQAAKPLIGEQECFCIPHRTLCEFYGRIGFVAIAASQAPGFLQERLARYRAEYGLDVIVMRRSSRVRANVV